MPRKERLQIFMASGVVALTVGAAASAAPRAKAYERFLYVTADAKTASEVDAIWSRAEHVLEPHAPSMGAHTMAVTPETLAALRKAGIDAKVEPASVQRMVDESYRENDAPHASAAPSAFGTWFDKVEELAAIES